MHPFSEELAMLLNVLRLRGADLSLVLIFPNSLTSSGNEVMARREANNEGITLAPLDSTAAVAISATTEDEDPVISTFLGLGIEVPKALVA